MAIEYAFNALGIDHILADCIEKNRRSQHVLEKLGFSCVGEDNGFKYYHLNRTERGQ